MFLWAGGRRDMILFRNPSGLLLKAEDVPEQATEVWYADCCPSDLTDPAGGRPFRVFDHHVSNARKFETDPRCTFDMNKSGTSLMAHVLGLGHCYESAGISDPIDEDAQRLIDALEAYDLGHFDHQNGEFLADLAATYSQIEMLDLLIKCGTDVFHRTEMIARVDGVVAMRKLYADAAFRAVRWDEIADGDCGVVRVGVAVSPVYWKNEVANRILHSGKADVAVIFDPTGGMVSMRANPGAPDVSVIAEMYGGGGHARSAGFKANSWDMLKALMSEVFG